MTDYLNFQTAVFADFLEAGGHTELAEAFRCYSYELGKPYLIRTATHTWVGKIVAFSHYMLILSEASWVMDTGRFADCLADGLEAQSESEIEPAPGFVRVNHQMVIDVCEYIHPLPTKQK